LGTFATTQYKDLVIIILKFSKFGDSKNLKTHTFSHFEKKVSQLARSDQKTKTPKSWA
jgi:hypothetical protein